MTTFNPDLASHIMSLMPCSATSALQAKTMSDRDMTAAEDAELYGKVLLRAEQLAGSDGFASDVVCELNENWFRAIGQLSINEANSLVTQSVVGQKILNAIRGAAIRMAEKELGA